MLADFANVWRTQEWTTGCYALQRQRSANAAPTQRQRSAMVFIARPIGTRHLGGRVPKTYGRPQWPILGWRPLHAIRKKVAGDREVGDDTARPVAKFSMSVIAW
jgi:hypothetical protein